MTVAAEFADTAVIVVNFGSSDLLRRTLVPLSRANPGLLVVVVDNRSTSAETVAVTALGRAEGWQAETLEDNRGFGAGMNHGVAAAAARGRGVVVLLNPDAEIRTESLRALRSAVAEDPMLLAAPRIERPDGSMWSEGSDLYLGDGRMRSRRRRVPGSEVQEWLSGACLALTMHLWTAVGGFDSRYFLYWEDVDLSSRVLAAGGSLRLVSEAVAVHAEGGTQGAGSRRSGDPKSSTYYYYNVRNRILFAALRLDDRHARAWRRSTIRVSYEILLQGGRRRLVTDFPKTVLPAVRGIRDGRRLARLHRTAS